MKLTSKCQVTIPRGIREKLGIFPGSEVDFVVDGDSVNIVKAPKKNGTLSRGEQIVQRAIGKATINLDLTTDQIMAITRGWGEDDYDR
ncbi:MAG: AbrB/MazE/SpoVT family DNA-binding domain-containing protein [Pyrinomonadaceae bacterium]